MKKTLKKVKKASKTANLLSSDIKNELLKQMANELIKKKDDILKANKIDLKQARENKLSPALIDRLLLDDKRIEAMSNSLNEIAAQEDPVGKTLATKILDNGLKIQKVSVSIGVIAIIYESRPNVTSDTAGLCLKSGNACVLKGGKEAKYSNEIIANILRGVLEKNKLPKDIISLFGGSREEVGELIKQEKYIDLIIPRGGEGLVKFISKNSLVPVIKHDKGVCHLYIDQNAHIDKSLDVTINAKCQRPGVCNAIETLLVHKDIAQEFLPKLKAKLDEIGVELRGCKKTMDIIDVKKATKSDWDSEYLANILSIRVVKSIKQAIKHISKHGSMHSEAIMTQNKYSAQLFLALVDASCVYVNASTRFTDGGVFGLGAEIGISTNKLHARGPVGARHLTTYKYKIYGNGQARD